MHLKIELPWKLVSSNHSSVAFLRDCFMVGFSGSGFSILGLFNLGISIRVSFEGGGPRVFLGSLEESSTKGTVFILEIFKLNLFSELFIGATNVKNDD